MYLNSNVAIVGDIHIQNNPSSRIDNYVETCLNKIEQIIQDYQYVIFLGDIFSTPKTEPEIVNKLICLLHKYKIRNNAKYYTICGNHDLLQEREDSLLRTSLGILASCDVMNIILPEQPITINNWTFHTAPVNCKKAKQYLQDKIYEDNSVLLLHHEYETGTYCITYNDLYNKNCKHVFFGHDHCPMENGRTVYENFTVYRSGSLLRNLATDYNFTRHIYYYDFSTIGGTVHCKPIIQQLAQQVFTQEAFSKENYKKKKFVESIDSIIGKYKNNIGNQPKFSIKSALQELNTPDNIIKYIGEKYNSIGEVFE